MHQSPPPHQQPGPPATAYGQQPWPGPTSAPPAGADWPYPPHRASWGSRLNALWANKSLRATALIVLLSLSGLVILALVRKQTGTEGFLVGLGLAILPVPLLIAAFRWMDRIEPEPWRNLIFAFAWGACAATLVAIIANGFATDWLITNVVDSSSSQADVDAWGATLVAPVVEE
ncbi:PrsW family intramembrane metalloprotease, partial [Streptomyces sp. MCAF7]